MAMEIDGVRARPSRTRRPWPLPVTIGVVLLLAVIGYTALQGSQWPVTLAQGRSDPAAAPPAFPAPSISITIDSARGVIIALSELPAGARGRVHVSAFTGPGCAPLALAGVWSMTLDVLTVERLPTPDRRAATASTELVLAWPWGTRVERLGHSWRARVIGDDGYAGTAIPRPFTATSTCRFG